MTDVSFTSLIASRTDRLGVVFALSFVVDSLLYKVGWKLSYGMMSVLKKNFSLVCINRMIKSNN
jgi:hypothetical protein